MLIPRAENGASRRHPSPPPVERTRGTGLEPVPASPESRIRSSPSPPRYPGPECGEAVELLRRLLVVSEDRRRKTDDGLSVVRPLSSVVGSPMIPRSEEHTSELQS